MSERTQPQAPPTAAAAPETPAVSTPAGGDAGSARVSIPEGLSFELPEAWRSVPPKSAMRRAEYRIPPVTGDSEEAELVLFYFGPGQGGTVEANIDRWFKMFEDEQGMPARGAQKQEARAVNSLAVTIVETAGIYSEPLMPGMQAKEKKPNYRLFGAIVETPKGSFFFKGTGPDKTMAASRPALIALVDSLQFP
jgi:hypothetical protein